MLNLLLGASGVPEYSREEKRDFTPWAERAHNVVQRVRKLELHEGTSFVGMWAEALPVSTIIFQTVPSNIC